MYKDLTPEELVTLVKHELITQEEAKKIVARQLGLPVEEECCKEEKHCCCCQPRFITLPCGLNHYPNTQYYPYWGTISTITVTNPSTYTTYSGNGFGGSIGYGTNSSS